MANPNDPDAAAGPGAPPEVLTWMRAVSRRSALYVAVPFDDEAFREASEEVGITGRHADSMYDSHGHHEAVTLARTDGFQEIVTPPDEETEYQYALRKVLLGDRRSIIFPHFKDTSPYVPRPKIADINRSVELDLPGVVPDMAPLDWGSANDALTLLTPTSDGFTLAYRPLFSPNVPTEQVSTKCLIANVHLIRWSPNCRSIAVCDSLCAWIMDLKGQSLKIRHTICFDGKPNDIIWESNTSFWVATKWGVEKIDLASGKTSVIADVKANAIAWDGNNTLVVGSDRHFHVFSGSSPTKSFQTKAPVTVVDVWRGSIAYGTADGTVGMISIAGNDSRDVSVDGPVTGVMWNVGGKFLAAVGRKSVSIFKRDGAIVGTCIIPYDSIGALRDPRRVRIAVVTDFESLAVYEVFKDKVPKKEANDRSPLAKSLR